MGLLAIRFPNQPPADLPLQQMREKIALMEQCYAHLGSIRDTVWWAPLLYGPPSFALELNIPVVGEELAFYVAVSRRLLPAVEKAIQGIFPDAHVERSDDYNIFAPQGAASGAVLRLERPYYFPVRTYQKLEGDPIAAITNAFMKLAASGEGAALQIVARPARDKWRKKMKEYVRDLYAGKRPPERDDAFLKTLRGAVAAVDAMKAPAAEPDKAAEAAQRKMTPLEEELARAIDHKANQTLFETNIRIIAAAPTANRATDIVREIGLAFEQFADSNLNRFNMTTLSGKRLERLIFQFSFRSFAKTDIALLGTEELTSLFHFENVPLRTPRISRVRAREAPAPTTLAPEGLLLGYNVFRGQTRNVYIQDDDRRRHLYIIGQTGTGKSVFLKNMIIQDIAAGRGVCVIDPHGDMVEDILGFVPRERASDVVYFNPGDTARPMGLNMLEYDERFPEQKTFVVNELLSIFIKLFGQVPEAIGPMFQQYFRNATLLVIEDPSSGSTILEIGRVLAEKNFRDLKLSRSQNIVVNQFWTEVAEKAGGEGELRNMVPYITSKTDNFVANEIMRPIIAQQKSAFNFRDIIDNRKILLVNLSKGRLGEINSSFIGLIVVGKLLMAAFSRVDIPEQERTDFYLYIDEFQNVTTPSIATILSEARKYKLDMTITHQFIGQLTDEIKKAVFGNVGSVAAFRIGSDDAEFMAKQFAPVFAEQDLLNIENANAAVKLLVRGATSQPFSMKTFAPEKGNPETAAIIKEMSRMTYGRPREEVEADIASRHQSRGSASGMADE